jgi:MFS family permease
MPAAMPAHQRSGLTRAGRQAVPQPPPAVRPAFVAGYTIAQIGAYIAFVPLLQVLVPLQTVRIAPLHPAALLSLVALVGAVTASVANLVAGALSDRTPARWGRRRSWLIGGLLATVLSYALVARAGRPATLVGALVVFQIAFNAMFAPLVAVFADRVPNRQKGIVSACIGLGYPVGSVVGAALVGTLVSGAASRLAALALLVTAAILPFALTLHEAPSPAFAATASPNRRDFVVALLGRFCVITALTLMQTYLLLFLQSLATHGGTLHAPPEAEFARLVAISTVANIAGALLIGIVSDRIGQRRPFVCLGAVLIGCGIAATARAASWPALETAWLLYGAGSGIYHAVDLALLAQLLPASDRAGRGLGLANLANTLPQIIAPLLGLRLLHSVVPDYPTLFALAATMAVIGGGMTLLIQSAR